MSVWDYLFVGETTGEIYSDAELMNLFFHLHLNPAKWFYDCYCLIAHDCKFFHYILLLEDKNVCLGFIFMYKYVYALTHRVIDRLDRGDAEQCTLEV